MQSSATEADIGTEGTEFDDEDFDYTKGMPDRKQFKEFYDSIVPSGSEMVLENFIKYPDVKRLLEEGLIYYDDVYSLWISAVGDAAGLDADEAYEMLCMVSDLPDPEDIEFLNTEFKKLENPSGQVTLTSFLSWGDIQDMINEKVLTEEQVEQLWVDLVGDTEKSIDRIQFGVLNQKVDEKVEENEELESSAATISKGLEKKVNKNSDLVGKEDKEDKEEDLVDLTGVNVWDSSFDPASVFEEDMYNEVSAYYRKKAGADDNEVGLSESEKQLMEVLDKADNMLNSGSFGDFDQLIGDVNDPRLQALRDQQQEQQEKVRGEIDEVLSELVSLAGRQSRCGMDLSPDTEEGIRLRTLVSAVLERSPKQADQQLGAIKDKLSGNWTLLYTNSEMFSFYNGITGLVNVYPSSRFESLSVSISPGSYLNEAKYLERIKTPLGVVDAAVFANWDLMKEMSFMTNENSVVLRTYCTRVTAGPFEYQAEENWKSLRTVSMNEVVYVDDRVLIMRNSGALRIFFLFVKS
eukprot:gene898-1003_t